MLCNFLKRSLISVFRRQNCHEFIRGTGGWSFLHCIEKRSAQLLRKKDPKYLSHKAWTNTVDFHADFKHNRNQRYLSWREGRTTKQKQGRECKFCWYPSHIDVGLYQCTDLLAQRQDCSCIWESGSGWMQVTKQNPNDTPVLSNVCLTCAPVTLPILREMESTLCTVPGKGGRQGWGYWMSQKMLTGVSSGSQCCCKVTFLLCNCHLCCW